ncbi:MAG: DUF3109 family protein [Acidobacteria bacterium]|nr:DUF3109 family protein [Acidobacteriota bacterium]
MPLRPFVVLNLDEARFECTFGRGCDGICCHNGRPPVYPEERDRIDAVLPRILPLMRSSARKLVERDGYFSRRMKAGQPSLRVDAGWCVFFNHGCVLHKLGIEEGDPFRYKPCICSLFPLDRRADKSWYVRQRGYAGEIWDLPCLTPGGSTPQAAISLHDELALASRIHSGSG